MNLIIICTSGRAKVFNDHLVKIISKQTTRDFDVLVVGEDLEGYKIPKGWNVIRRDGSADTMPSLCHNWISALDWIDKHEDYEKFVVAEDDDFYGKTWVIEITALLDRADLVGFHEDAYYYVLSRKARRVHNIGFAALAATAFNRKVLSYMRLCCEQGNTFIDGLLWKGIQRVSYMAQPPIKTDSGSIQPKPIAYYEKIAEFKGRKLLANNFTGVLYGVAPEIKYDAAGKLQIIMHQAVLDETGMVKDEYPRHVGMKEPFHGGSAGTSIGGHDPRWRGGPDILGATLRKWIGEDAKMYLKYTSDPPSPPPALQMVPMAMDSVG